MAHPPSPTRAQANSMRAVATNGALDPEAEILLQGISGLLGAADSAAQRELTAMTAERDALQAEVARLSSQRDVSHLPPTYHGGGSSALDSPYRPPTSTPAAASGLGDTPTARGAGGGSDDPYGLRGISSRVAALEAEFHRLTPSGSGGSGRYGDGSPSPYHPPAPAHGGVGGSGHSAPPHGGLEGARPAGAVGEPFDLEAISRSVAALEAQYDITPGGPGGGGAARPPTPSYGGGSAFSPGWRGAAPSATPTRPYPHHQPYSGANAGQPAYGGGSGGALDGSPPAVGAGRGPGGATRSTTFGTLPRPVVPAVAAPSPYAGGGRPHPSDAGSGDGHIALTPGDLGEIVGAATAAGVREGLAASGGGAPARDASPRDAGRTFTPAELEVLVEEAARRAVEEQQAASGGGAPTRGADDRAKRSEREAAPVVANPLPRRRHRRAAEAPQWRLPTTKKGLFIEKRCVNQRLHELETQLVSASRVRDRYPQDFDDVINEIEDKMDRLELIEGKLDTYREPSPSHTLCQRPGSHRGCAAYTQELGSRMGSDHKSRRFAERYLQKHSHWPQG